MDSTPPTSNPMPSPVWQQPPASSLSKSVAYALSAFFLTTATLYVVIFASDYQAATLSGWFAALTTSPWGVTALADYITGSIFAAVFLWLRDGPKLVFIPSRVIAVVAPFVGSLLVLLYMAWLMFRLKSVDYAVVPLGSRGDRRPVFDPPARKGTSVGLGMLFGVLLVGFIGVVLWAMGKQTLSDGVRDFREVSYHYVTFWDNLIGLLVPALVIAVRDWGRWGTIGLWWTGLALTGNAATCLYVLRLVRQSMKKNLSFKYLLLSEEAVRP